MLGSVDFLELRIRTLIARFWQAVQKDKTSEVCIGRNQQKLCFSYDVLKSRIHCLHGRGNTLLEQPI